MMKIPLVIGALCAFAWAQESFESAGVSYVLKIYDECASSGSFGPCLKKKAIGFIDRAARMDKLPLMEGVTLIRSGNVVVEDSTADNEIGPRGLENRDEELNAILYDKIGNLLGSRTVEISMPKVSDLIEEGRKKSDGGSSGLGGGGGGGGGKMKMGGMMGGMMMAIAAKMAALIPLAIAGLFLLAGKALLTAKIALLLSGIIAIKKLFAAKQGSHGGGGGGGHGGWASGGGGGWQPPSGGGGGWDRRSYEISQQLAYKNQKQA